MSSDDNSFYLSNKDYQSYPHVTDYSYQHISAYYSSTYPSETVLYASSTHGYKPSDSTHSLIGSDKEKYGYGTTGFGYHYNTTQYKKNKYDNNKYYDSAADRNGIHSNNFYGDLYPSDCSDYFQRRINSCAYMLEKLGAFGQTTPMLEKFTMSNIFRKSREEFLNICNAYILYNGCLGDNSVKKVCYSLEPFRSHYTPVDSSLSYACGEGYLSLFISWHCIREAASSLTYMECTNIIAVVLYGRRNIDYQMLSNSLSLCSSLQAYLDCIRRALDDRCGQHAHLAVLTTVRRSVETIFPYCTLAATWHAQSLILQVIFAVIFYLFSSPL